MNKDIKKRHSKQNYFLRTYDLKLKFKRLPFIYKLQKNSSYLTLLLDGEGNIILILYKR